MTDSRCDVLIIGGGAVGLGVALEITRRFPRQKLLLIEKEDGVARHQSGHNSGVIHSGVRALQVMLPRIEEKDLVPGGSGVRAQSLKPDGALVDDFQFVPSGKVLHVLNVPSPAATASLMIGKTIVDTAAANLGLH